MSRRTFTRLFRKETGLTFSAWRQQACLFAAMPRLAADEAVTTVALDLGYDSPAAFTTMFKRLMGVPPSRYFSARDGRAGKAQPPRRRVPRAAPGPAPAT
jgi:AraC-like DNA-binding protein